MSPVIYQLLLIIHFSNTNTALIISRIFTTVLINITVSNVVNLVITITNQILVIVASQVVSFYCFEYQITTFKSKPRPITR